MSWTWRRLTPDELAVIAVVAPNTKVTRFVGYYRQLEIWPNPSEWNHVTADHAHATYRECDTVIFLTPLKED